MKSKKLKKEAKKVKKPKKEIDGFLAYQFYKAQNQIGAEYDGLGIKIKD